MTTLPSFTTSTGTSPGSVTDHEAPSILCTCEEHAYGNYADFIEVGPAYLVKAAAVVVTTTTVAPVPPTFEGGGMTKLTVPGSVAGAVPDVPPAWTMSGFVATSSSYGCVRRSFKWSVWCSFYTDVEGEVSVY